MFYPLLHPINVFVLVFKDVLTVLLGLGSRATILRRRLEIPLVRNICVVAHSRLWAEQKEAFQLGWLGFRVVVAEPAFVVDLAEALLLALDEALLAKQATSVLCKGALEARRVLRHLLRGHDSAVHGGPTVHQVVVLSACV